jgi:hypothetical protein
METLSLIQSLSIEPLQDSWTKGLFSRSEESDDRIKKVSPSGVS